MNVEELSYRASRRTDFPCLDASQLRLVRACAASAAISRSRSWLDHLSAIPDEDNGQSEAAKEAAIGRLAGHQHVTADELEQSRAEADSWTWIAPAGALGRLELNLLDNGRLVLCTERRPHKVEGSIFSASIDVMWGEPLRLAQEGDLFRCLVGSKLVVGKYMLGSDSERRAPEHDEELIASTVMAQRWTEAFSSEARIIVVTDGDGVHERVAVPRLETSKTKDTLRATGWQEFVFRVKTVVAQVEACRAQATSGAPLDFCVGGHCLECVVSPRCPAWLAELEALVGVRPEKLSALARGSNPVLLAHVLLFIEAIKRKVRSSLKRYVEKTGPIDLGDGRRWGPVVHKYHVYDGPSAIRTLEALLGQNLPGGSFRLSESALRGLVEEMDVNQEAVMEQLHKILNSSGGVVEEKTTQSYVVHAPEGK